MRPLAGKTVVITRPKAQSAPLVMALAKAGARVVAAPTIKIVPPSSFRKLDAALKTLETFDGVIFTSRNAVEKFFEHAKTLRRRLTRPGRLYAVGTQTAKALAERGWRGARTPKVHRGEALAEALGDVRGLKLLLPRAKAARDVLPGKLRKKGATLSVVEAYRTVVDHSSARALKKAARGGLHAVAFTSGSTVESFVKQLGKAETKRLFAKALAVSIGPITTAELRKHGIRRVAQAKTATTQALARAVIEALR